MKKQIQKTLYAFTLIEIMVVIAIVGIMSILLLIGFGESQSKRVVETNAREFIGVVREFQNNALSGKQLVVGTDPCRYEIKWSGASYEAVYWYKNASGACTQTSTAVTHPLKNGVVFSSAASFYFTLPHAVLSFSGGNMTAVFTKGGASHVACVYANGRITDQPGAVCP